MALEVLILKEDNISEVAKAIGQPEREVGWMLEDARALGRNKVVITVDTPDVPEGFGRS